MSFSEKMRDSLGARGVQVSVHPVTEPLRAGATSEVTLEIRGGNEAAQIDALVVRIVEAYRHWLDSSGQRHLEDDVHGLERRDHLTAGWDRHTVHERRLPLSRFVEPGSIEAITVEVEVPEDCGASSVSRSHTINVQADIKGQIDPTANARVRVVTPT